MEENGFEYYQIGKWYDAQRCEDMHCRTPRNGGFCRLACFREKGIYPINRKNKCQFRSQKSTGGAWFL